VFRKPAWRIVLPILMILAVWAVPFVASCALAPESAGPLWKLIGQAGAWLHTKGLGTVRACWLAGFLSIPLVYLLWTGLETLTVTSDAITRRRPGGARWSLRWLEVDEVLIEHIEQRMEDHRTDRKIMTLYAVRRPWRLWRRRMIITNRQFRDFHNVERLVTHVSIPAIAERMRRKFAVSGKPACFMERDPAEGFHIIVHLAFAGLLTGVWASPVLWSRFPVIAVGRPYVAGAAALILLLVIRKFFYRQVAIDQRNIYIMRRSHVTRTIPLDSVIDVRVKDNLMRIFARREGTLKPKQVFKTRRFIRNRGVLLRLIREAHDQRRIHDLTPIPPIPSIHLEPDHDHPDAELPGTPHDEEKDSGVAEAATDRMNAGVSEADVKQDLPVPEPLQDHVEARAAEPDPASPQSPGEKPATDSGLHE
jgi:hypothetical protein